jgi:hypothetical protein
MEDNKTITVSPLAGWRYVCLGPNGTPILTDSPAEARFWRSLDYVVRAFLRPATGVVQSQGDQPC